MEGYIHIQEEKGLPFETITVTGTATCQYVSRQSVKWLEQLKDVNINRGYN